LPGETHLAYEAMIALRPHIGSESDFVRRVDDVQRPEGYRIVASFVEGSEQAVAAAGFRVLHFLAWGDALYCDDLTTLPEHRGHGYAGALLPTARTRTACTSTSGCASRRITSRARYVDC